MVDMTIRNLRAEVERRIRQRAAENNRSMEAEARAILTAAVAEADFRQAWSDMAAGFRGDDVEVPSRSAPRDIDLT